MKRVLRPIGSDLLLYIPNEPEEKTEGGIVLRGTQARSNFRTAFVRSAGPRYSGDLVPGDRVLLPPYAGREVTVDGERLAVIKEREIPAVADE